jgi:copper homeostasis protein
MRFSLEIACFNKESALIAAASGADRIEFAADYTSGGITPQLEDFKEIKSRINIPVYILIRCRPGDFFYTADETEEMTMSIHSFREAGADGFVFGCLDEENRIDIGSTKKLFRAATPLPCTFHRAFDRLTDMEKGLEQIIQMDFQSILTSGGARTAWEGLDRLNELREQSAGRICIMPGGGIRSGNISLIRNKFAGPWFHSAGITGIEPMADPQEIKKLKQIT